MISPAVGDSSTKERSPPLTCNLGGGSSWRGSRSAFEVQNLDIRGVAWVKPAGRNPGKRIDSMFVPGIRCAHPRLRNWRGSRSALEAQNLDISRR